MLTRLHGARIWVGIPTVDGREHVLKHTEAAVTRVISRPTVYKSPLPVGIANVRDNQRRIMCDAVTVSATLLYVEDDVAINVELMRRALRRFLHADFADRICTFYLPGMSFYPKRVRAMLGSEMTETTFRIVNSSRFWGSQAVLVPQQLVQRVLKVARDERKNFDMAIRRIAPIWSYLPNPVQHLDEPPKWSPYGHRHHSVSYA
jgi:hypothetical protein